MKKYINRRVRITLIEGNFFNGTPVSNHSTWIVFNHEGPKGKYEIILKQKIAKIEFI